MRNDVIVEKSKLDETVEVYRKKIADSTDVSSKDFKPKRVAAYCRVSKNIEMQESSLETQMEAYQRVISERVDWQLVEVYYDRGITGTCVAKRPGFMRMNSIKLLCNPFRILCAERFFFSAGFLLLLFTLDAVNDLIRFFFALQIDPETVFLADGLFNCLGSLEFNISADGFPFLHQSNGIIGDCPDEQIFQNCDCPVDNRFLPGFRRRMILYNSSGLYNMFL